MTIITDTMTREDILNLARSWGWKESSARAFAEGIEQLREKMRSQEIKTSESANGFDLLKNPSRRCPIFAGVWCNKPWAHCEWCRSGVVERRA